MTNDPLFPEDSDEERVEPKVQSSSEKGNGGSGGPRRPTAVGAGSPDDEEWSKLIARLQGVDTEKVDSEEIISWPIPDLSFVKIKTPIPWSQVDTDRQKNSHDEIKVVEDTLVELHSQKANIAFVILDNDQGMQSYFGVAVPGEEGHLTGVSTIAKTDETISAERLQELMKPLVQSAGVMVGIPSKDAIADSGLSVEQRAKLRSELKGYGAVVLAIPIPEYKVTSEEFQVIDQIQRAQDIESETSKRIKNYLDLQESYLNHVQHGTTVGHWLVGGFYFAANKSNLLQLESMIAANYQDDQERPMPLRTQELSGLEPHVCQFGLLRNKHSGEVFQELLEYKFLYPLNSHQLVRYMA